VLQWGRGCVATESWPNYFTVADDSGLQWGRGCVATEIARGHDLVDEDLLTLQWGRGCVATEMSSGPS